MDKSKNAVNVIYPYRTPRRDWVFDDKDLELKAEAFVMGTSEMIDHLVGEKAMNFRATISAAPLPKTTATLSKITDKRVTGGMTGWYQLEGTGIKHWLCGVTTLYFTGYPDKIYVHLDQIKNK